MGRYARVLLVGFMASGKSTVGRALSERIGWPFVDFDDEIEDQEGRSIPEIFAEDGEAHFRKIEDRVGARLLARSEVVLASGGGWPAVGDHMDALSPDTLSVWLRITPEEAVRRARSSGVERPLLQVQDPISRAAELLRAREESYRKAGLTLDAEGKMPDALVQAIVEALDLRK